MKSEELSTKLKKNLLDLSYNKYLQYINTCLILLFTYVVGVLVGFITKQIDYKNIGQMFAVGIVSIPVITILVLFILYCREQLKKISEGIESLDA